MWGGYTYDTSGIKEIEWRQGAKFLKEFYRLFSHQTFFNSFSSVVLFHFNLIKLYFFLSIIKWIPIGNMKNSLISGGIIDTQKWIMKW